MHAHCTKTPIFRLRLLKLVSADLVPTASSELSAKLSRRVGEQVILQEFYLERHCTAVPMVRNQQVHSRVSGWNPDIDVHEMTLDIGGD